MKKGDRIILNNPGGYPYRGTLIVKAWPENPAISDWWEIDWDVKSHPCTSPMQEKHLILLSLREIVKEAIDEYVEDIDDYLADESIPMENFRSDIKFKLTCLNLKIEDIICK